MAIHSIDKVTIDGHNRAFGGFIYAVDFEVGVLDSPSKVVVTLVNDNGIYIEPELSVSKSYQIKIGNIIDDSFYAIERKISKSSSGRTLEVTFYDGSLILDRIWVGLNKRMGDGYTSVDGLIIVGREIHPCDVNDDGVFDKKDVSLLTWQGIDPCELKCPTTSDSREPLIEECIDKELKTIFDVKYSIKDLFDALEGKVDTHSESREMSYPIENDLSVGTTSIAVRLPTAKANPNTPPINRIPIKQRPAITNTFYKASYTGTLREVLRSWCGDFGWSFTWESGQLVFLDTKQRPNIKLPNFNDQLHTFTDTKTLEGTVSRGFASTYLQPGIDAKPSCKQSSPMMLHCLTLKDLFGETYKPQLRAIVPVQGDFQDQAGEAPPDPDNKDSNDQIEYFDDIAPKGVAIAELEKACIISRISSHLRNAYIQWNYYGIVDSASAQKLEGKWLDRLGQVKIIAVYGPDTQATKYKEILSTGLVYEGIDHKNKTLFSLEDAAKIAKDKGIVVFVRRRSRHAKVDEMQERQFRIEHQLASAFMGQHWYKGYRSPSYGDGSTVFPAGQYFGQLSIDANELQFAKFKHTWNSNVAGIVGTYRKKQLNTYKTPRAAGWFSPSGNSATGQKIVRSLIYMHRSERDMWSPTDDTRTDFKSLLDIYEPLAPTSKSLDDFTTDAKKQMLTVDKVNKFDAGAKETDYGCLSVMVLYPPPKDNPLKITAQIDDHINKVFPQHTESEEAGALITVGMLSNKCAVYNINGKKVYTPIGASVLFDNGGVNKKFSLGLPAATTSEFSDPTFKVMVTSSTNNRGCIPKTEITYVQHANMQNARRVEYKIHSLDRNSIRFLNQLTVECRLNPSQIQALHNKLAKNLNFSVTKPFQSLQYEIFGVTAPTSLSPSTGLESLRIRVDGQGGVTTSISLGDKLFTPASEDVILRALENGISPKLAALIPNTI